MNNSTTPVCLYHKNCLDGIASAWVVWKHFKGAVELYPIQYGDELPVDVKGRKVYVVDFSFDAKKTLELAQICDLTVLDHHDTAAKTQYKLDELLGDDPFPGEFIVDQDHSGAMVTWNYFHQNETPPTQLRLVEDRDLWKWQFATTKRWTAAAFSHPFNDVHAFDRLMTQPVLTIVTEGEALLRKQELDVDRISKNARTINIDGVEFGAINATSNYASDVGDKLSPEYPGVAIYVDGRDGRIFSLRSNKHTGVIVNAIAERFGGGGHKNAAGFKLPFSDPRFKNSHIKLRSKGYYWRKLKSLVGLK